VTGPMVLDCDPGLDDAVALQYALGSGRYDIRAVTAGIRLAREMVAALNGNHPVAVEELPGAHIRSDEALAEYVRDNAWGHHASCSCAIGPRERDGVLGSDFTSVGTPPPAGSPVSLQINRSASSPPTKLPDDLTVTNAADTTCE